MPVIWLNQKRRQSIEPKTLPLKFLLSAVAVLIGVFGGALAGCFGSYLACELIDAV